MENEYTEEYLKNCDMETIINLYNNQYDEELNIPSIDRDKEEGEEQTVYKIYIYGNCSKYLCRVFNN